jgi:hypothetical protein
MRLPFCSVVSQHCFTIHLPTGSPSTTRGLLSPAFRFRLRLPTLYGAQSLINPKTRTLEEKLPLALLLRLPLLGLAVLLLTLRPKVVTLPSIQANVITFSILEPAKDPGHLTSRDPHAHACRGGTPKLQCDAGVECGYRRTDSSPFSSETLYLS